ncbi:MAG: DegT/DnrJ/EryC1/StrS family aminotransferase [Gemmatimonadaceae bacterium]
MIPVNEPVFGEREAEYTAECIRTGWVSSAGRFIEEFEQRWAAYCGMKYGVAVNNGTSALELAVGTLGLQPGDEVIIPSFTIISCAVAVIRNGGVPVLVDCDPVTFGLDASQLESRITSRTRAIMPVHIYGHPVDMDPILALAKKHGLVVIEDAAEVHGAEYHAGRSGASPQWRRCGGLGDISTFSFYANKLVTTGEGGMALTNDANVADRMRGRRNLCFRSERRFWHTELGNNFRLTNLQAAVGVAQVERIDEIVARKRRMGHRYTAQLDGLAQMQLPVEQPWARAVYWMYAVVLDDAAGFDAIEFARRLKVEGVETRPFFLGMHEQPALHQRGLFGGEHYPVTERIARQGLYLPSGLALTDDQIDQVCAAVRRTLA